MDTGDIVAGIIGFLVFIAFIGEIIFSGIKSDEEKELEMKQW